MPAYEQAHMGLDFLPLSSLNIGGISVIKKRDLSGRGGLEMQKGIDKIQKI